MPANSALSGGELTSLNLGYHVAPSRLSCAPDTVVGDAEVATTPTTSPIVEISVTSPSAGWTDGRVGQTVKVTAPDGTLRGYYRLRHSAPTSSLIKIGATTNADIGLLNMGVRTEGIQAGDTVTILERYDLWSVAPRWDAAGTVYQDYDKAVSTLNTSPLPICNMTINGRAGDYCTEIANGAEKAMTATVTVTDNIGALTYSWTVPDDWTDVAGTNTATVTGDAPAGAYWLYCTITDATAGEQEIKRFVRIHTPADPPIECNVTRDTRDRGWRSVTVRLPQSIVSAIPAKARCVVWGDTTWGGSDVASANRSFTGYITSQPFSHQPAYHESNVEIVGTCGVLDLLKGYPAEFKYAGEQSTWEELPATRSTLQFIERWMCRNRMANVLETFNHTVLSTSTSTARFKNYSVDPGSLYSQLKQIMDSYEANVGSRSDGEIICARHPSMLADRSSVVTRATISNSIYKTIDVQWDRHPRCGHVRLDGRFTDLNANVRLASEAPGKNQYGQGSGQRHLQNKVFESQADANQRSGRQYAMENSEYPNITLNIPTNWDVFEPCDMQRVVVTVPAGKSPTGSALSITTIPKSVTKTWYGGRLAGIQLTTEAETNGVEGETGDVPSEGSFTFGDYGNYDIPDIGSVGWGDETDINPIDANGSGLIFTDDGHVARYRGDDVFEDISPSDSQRTGLGTGIKMIADPWNYAGLILFGSQGALQTGDHTADIVQWQPIELAGSGQAASFTENLSVVVTSNTTTTMSVNTNVGTNYTVTVSGTFSNGPYPACDAYWFDSDEDSSETYGIGLKINGTFPDLPDYSGGHSYEFTIAGTGSPFTFNYFDTDYGDNSGGPLSVRVEGVNAVLQTETFTHDIAGSINQDKSYFWFSTREIGGTAYLYVNRTFDDFATRKSTQIARYVDGMGYSLQLGSYGSPGNIVVMCTAGDPGTTDSGVYKSLNSAATFAKITGTDLLPGGGALGVPYQVAGAANASTSPTFAYVRGIAGGTVQFRSYSGATVNIAAGSVPHSGYVLNSHTLDGNYLALPFSNQKLYTSDDGGDNWSLAGTIPGSGVRCMTGWPSNPDWHWGAGTACLHSTDDRGANWDDQRADFDTFRASDWSGDGETVVSCFGDLSAFYGTEVTQ